MKVLIELADDEVLVALKRGEDYEDVHPEILADDAIGGGWPESRTLHGEQVVPANACIKPPTEGRSAWMNCYAAANYGE